MSISPLEIAEIFADDGPLAAAIPGFSVRVEQVSMAEVIADALVQGRRCVIEAGTGIAIVVDVLGHTFRKPCETLASHARAETISIGIAAPKGPLSPAAEKFWDCAKEAASPR